MYRTRRSRSALQSRSHHVRGAMPGIVDPCSVGLCREVGKMAHSNSNSLSDLDMLDFTTEEAANLEEFAQYLQSDRSNTVIDTVLSDESAPSSSSSSPSRDESEEGELPESENAFNLNKFLDIRDIAGIMLTDHCEDEELRRKQCKLKQPSSNPFMGSAGENRPGHRYSLFEDHHDQPNQAQHTEHFVAWNHSPPYEDEHLLMLISSSLNDDTDENTLPDTPSTPFTPSTSSSYSEPVTGDDSDVDIETIPDIPRTADACGYATQDSSPASSPATSPSSPTPLQNHATSNTAATALHRSSSSPVFSSYSQPLIRFNSCGVKNNVSLAENLMCGRPTVAGQKRKLQREKKSVCKSNTSTFHQNITFQTSSSSVNFHDYAMSPISCTSIETAQTTIVTSKRLYKRRQLNTLDLSEKEKQHHHNQLERNRRQKLADLFMDLRDEVPNIAHNTKASKVMILNQATSYILDLQRHEGSQVQQISKELEKSQFLKRQKRQLESQLSLSIK